MIKKLKSVLMLTVAFSLIVLLSKSNNISALPITFSDDFNRSDGPVGNGWTSWWAGSFDSPNSMIVNGELRAYGYPQYGGGIFRTLPVSLPVQFSFDFRTDSNINEDCGSPSFNDGGWRITLNAAPSASPMDSVAQVKFEQWAGSRHTVRRYITNTSTTDQTGMAEDVALAVPGQRDFTENPSHIEGIIYSDLSAEFAIHYNDGQSPDPVVISFGPASGAIDYQPGSLLMISNSNCSSGPHYIDNFTIGPFNPTPTPTPTMVPFNFTGFFQPIDNLPALNVMNAGRGVPVKFSLDGNQGLDIFAPGYPTSSMVACGSTAEDAVEQTLTVGASSLTYDANANQYIYVWKTDKAWAGTCRTLVLKLSDGTYHRANFKFK
jgi:hypothetical protein